VGKAKTGSGATACIGAATVNPCSALWFNRHIEKRKTNRIGGRFSDWIERIGGKNGKFEKDTAAE